jgi:serum/glucocorticoid-regulated kinase 2
MYALKTVNKSKSDMNMMKNEIKILYMLDHDNLMNLYTHFEDDENLYLVLELMTGGDMRGMLDKRKKLKEREAQDFCN